MPLTLYVDEDRWIEHMDRTVANDPGIVPVVKGNAYGFGMQTLAGHAQALGSDTVAVGIYDELLQVIDHFGGDLMVMTPWRPTGELPPMDDAHTDRVIHTVGRLADLELLIASHGHGGQQPRAVIELGTSMRRHGLVTEELATAAALLDGVQVEGLTLHLPLVPPGSASPGAFLREIESRLMHAQEAGLPTHRMFVSHLSSGEMSKLAAIHPSVEWRPRVGTSLWVGDKAFLHQRATVVDVHKVNRGDRTGYSQLRIPAEGHLVVVAGGSSNGVEPESPSSPGTLARRALRIATTGSQTAGQWLSPFQFDDRQLWLSEPPHMQASSLFVPGGDPVPKVGDEIACQLDFASVVFDRVQFI